MYFIEYIEFVCPVTTSFPLLLPCKKRPGALRRGIYDHMLSPPYANTRVPHCGNLVNDKNFLPMQSYNNCN